MSIVSDGRLLRILANSVLLVPRTRQTARSAAASEGSISENPRKTKLLLECARILGLTQFAEGLSRRGGSPHDD